MFLFRSQIAFSGVIALTAMALLLGAVAAFPGLAGGALFAIFRR
jgi:hypothetical protein